MISSFRRSLKKTIASLYRQQFISCYSHVDTPVLDSEYEDTSVKLLDLLSTGDPCMVSRFGSVELECLANFIKGKHPLWMFRTLYPFWVHPSVYATMQYNAGFFSISNKMLARFADLTYDSAKQIDILGSWMDNESVVDGDMNYKKVKLSSLDPFWAKQPWSSYLKGKKVLVVHPFAETIKSQYAKRTLLFDNPVILPEFASLKVIKAVQSIGGESAGFNDWFEALDYMLSEIDTSDYEVALIGCGAYGMPIAAHCKKMGKQSIHLGGALQLLFGIKGRRWESGYGDRYTQLLNSPNWVRPLETETPTSAINIENGCYW